MSTASATARCGRASSSPPWSRPGKGRLGADPGLLEVEVALDLAHRRVAQAAVAAQVEQFLALAEYLGVAVIRLGTTTRAYDFTFGGVVRPFDALHETWSAPLRDFYASAPVSGAA